MKVFQEVERDLKDFLSLLDKNSKEARQNVTSVSRKEMGEDYSDMTICYAQNIFTQNLRTACSFRKASHVFEYFEKNEKLHPGNLRELKLGRISHQHQAMGNGGGLL